MNANSLKRKALEEGNEHAKMMSDETGELKNLVRKNKEQFESKIKSLTDTINNERKMKTM